MARLDFGLWDAVGGYEMVEASAADVYERHLCLAQEIEQLGYHSYWTIEHQNSDTGRITSPSVFLTAVARATSVLRVGAMIWQVPLHNPVRLAQEVAMLDNLSRGRVEFGSGLGVHEHEFLRWGADYSARAAMAEEAMTVIRMAWTQDEVTYEGKYWRFDEALPSPRPYQQPHPPIWVAAHSNASMEYAARYNFNVSQNIDTDAVVAEKFEHFRQTWRACNHLGPMPRIFLQRGVHVAETDEQARAEAEPYLVGPLARARVGGGRIAETRIGWGSHPRGMGAESERPDNLERGRVFQEAAKSYDFNIEHGLVLVGSPDTVIRKLEEGRQRIGYDLFCGNHQLGRMPSELTEKSIRLFGEAVIPAFA